MDFSQVIVQPWFLPTSIGLGAFLLGLITASVKKSGASWFSSLVLWPLRLLLEVLDSVHTKKFKYYTQVLTLLCIEGFFAFRAATVYYEVLGPRMAPAEIMVVSALVFVAIFLCGYMVATHPGKNKIITIFVILHDIAGTLWINYAIPGSTQINFDGGTFKAVLTLGMCGLSFVPFRMGKWVEELRPQLDAELAEEIESFTAQATHRIKRRAVERVLRLANRTDVIHLVQALPRTEFAEFKSFVMPIIAPGKPHNLTDADDTMIAMQVANSQTQETPQDRQRGRQKHATPLAKNMPVETPPSGQTGRQKTANEVAKNTPVETPQDRQNGSTDGSQKPASKTTKRDAKIRQFAVEHPDMTHAKLAARFKVSERTITRAFASAATSSTQDQQLEPVTPDVLAQERAPFNNGHNKTPERDTDKMNTITLSEEQFVSTSLN